MKVYLINKSGWGELLTDRSAIINGNKLSILGGIRARTMEYNPETGIWWDEYEHTSYFQVIITP